MRSTSPYTSINVVPGANATESLLWKNWQKAQCDNNPVIAQSVFLNTVLTDALPKLSVESLAFWDQIIKTIDQPTKDALTTPYKTSPTESAGSLYWTTDFDAVPYNKNIEYKLPDFVKSLNSHTSALTSQFASRTSEVATMNKESASIAAVSIFQPGIAASVKSYFADASRLSPIVSDLTGVISISSQAINYDLEGTNIVVDNFFTSNARTYIPTISSLKA